MRGVEDTSFSPSTKTTGQLFMELFFIILERENA